MAGKNNGTSKGVAQKIGAVKRRTLPDYMAVLDDTLTGVLNDTVDTKKANTIVAISGRWMSGVNMAIRASKTALPASVREAAGLLEAPVPSSK